MSVDSMVRSASGIVVGCSGFDLADFASLGGAARDQALIGVEALIDCLQVHRAEMIHAVAASGAFTDDGHHSARAWVAGALNTSSATASRLVRTAELLIEVPALAMAHRAGSVGSDQVDEFRKLHANPVCRAELQARGHRLVGPAKHLEFRDFREVVARWRAHVDPDAATVTTRHLANGATSDSAPLVMGASSTQRATRRRWTR